MTRDLGICSSSAYHTFNDTDPLYFLRFFSVPHLLWYGASVFVKVLQRATVTMTRDLWFCESSSAWHGYYDTGPLYLWRFFSVPHLLWHGTLVFVKVLQRATLNMLRDLGICEDSLVCQTYYDTEPLYLRRFFSVLSYCKFWIYWVGVNTKFTIVVIL